MKRFKRILKKVGLFGKYELNLKDEKGFINGRFIGTKWGITAPMLNAFLGRTPTSEDMRNLSRADAIQLLFEKNWLDKGIVNIDNDSIAALIYNGLVNIGTNEMRLLIKQVVIDLGYFIDYFDVFTPKGIDLLNKLEQPEFFNKLFSLKKRSFRKINNKIKRALFLKQLKGIRFFENFTKTSKNSLKNRIPTGIVKKIYECVNPPKPTT